MKSIYEKSLGGKVKEIEDAVKFNQVVTHDHRADILYGNTMGLSEEEQNRREMAKQQHQEEINQKFKEGKCSFGDLLYCHSNHNKSEYHNPGETSNKPKEDKPGYANPWNAFHGTIEGFKEFSVALAKNDNNVYAAWRTVKGSDEGLAEFMKVFNGFYGF